MSTFFNFIYEVLKNFFVSLFNILKEFFVNIFNAFNVYYYVKLFDYYKSDFSTFEFILAILSLLILVTIFLVCCYLIYLLVRKIIRITRNSVNKEKLLLEVGKLNNEVIKLSKEKDRLLQLKFDGLGYIDDDNRFYKLIQIDNKYKDYNIQDEHFNSFLNLKGLSDAFRNYCASNLGLFYDINTIRVFISSLGVSKLLLLQGISGTGKTSLPYAFGKFIENESYIASVQPSWKDKNEIIGYFNEFTKKFNETEILKVLYEATYTNKMYIIVLDEMNIARVEYYFAEMLSLLEMKQEDRFMEITTDSWDTDPIHLVNGKLLIPNNVWFVGTANNDESTFAISDKVYDRAMILNINSKGKVFDALNTDEYKLSADNFDILVEDAISKYKLSDDIKNKIKRIDDILIDKFKVSYGNRVNTQLELFIAMYVACGGTEEQAIDYFLSSKILTKLEGANLFLRKKELDDLEKLILSVFSKDSMTDAIDYVRLLKLR